MKFVIKEKYTVEDLVKIVQLLRDKDNGCPWDKEQTHASIRKNFIEETYEAIEAIDLDDKTLMQEELGDVLLQILLHSQFEAENNVFDFADVVDGISKKLVLRHPHIFQSFENKTVEGVLEKWEEIKKVEKGQLTVSQTLEAVPKSLPALMYAQKLQKRATAGGLVLATDRQIIDGLQENLNKICEQSAQGINLQQEISQMLFALVGLAQSQKIDAEEALSGENQKKLTFFKNLDN